MTFFKNSKIYFLKAVKVILILMVISVIMLFNKYLDFEKLKEIHTEKEKKIGNEKVNRQLYNYNEKYPFNKFIITDYQYLKVLPEINRFFRNGTIQDLKPSDPIFTDRTIGFILMTTIFNPSKELPDYIEERINSGEYIEIFNINDCRFIKIR